MDRLLRPNRLDLDPNSPTASKEWKHWRRTFTNFIEECGEDAPDKFRTLVNCVSHNVFDYIEECTDYESAIDTLQKLYVKTPNEVFARHLLATRRQQPGESLDEYLQELRKLSKDCNLKAVTAEQYREELIRDSFINGISSPLIRQRLLENRTLDLQTAYNQAYSLDLAQRNAGAYTSTPPSSYTAAIAPPQQPRPADTASFEDQAVAATYTKKKTCFFCGGPFHNRRNCPARDASCHICGKKGHFSKVCMSKSTTSTTATMFKPALLAITAAFPQSLSHAAAVVSVNGHDLNALIDSCSSDSFISEDAARILKLKVFPANKEISMALTTLNTNSSGHCVVDMMLNGRSYPSTHLGILKDLCSDMILGLDFQKQHKSLTIEFGGPKPELTVTNTTSHCALSAALVDEPSLFGNISPTCKPIATKSRRFSKDDQSFIEVEIARLLSEGIIEPSSSPWRAQIVVAKDSLQRRRKRMCVDYSQTINQYTELDAYPLPRIDDMVNDLANYSVFSTFDLKSAYHQIPIKEADSKYTAFEANGRLYQFRRIPFGVTNGVAVFQREMNKLVEEENLEGTFPYLDNVTIAGHNQAEHDENFKKFIAVVNRRKLTLNEAKTIKSVSSINILGYWVGNGSIKPDPERLRPLQELPPPTNLTSLRRALGMFAYYAKWISNFSDKIKPLVNTKTFPLDESALAAFTLIKHQLEIATLQSIDENLPFVVECDASEVAISAVLNQGGRPVAFMSRTLQGSEVHHPPVEKEATAIIEAVRKWSHFLARRHFTLITDQRSVAFMLDNRKRTKVKNNKIQEWRMELASFSYTIQYRPGKDNVAPDTLTRAFCCSTMPSSTLTDIHDGLCHPGVTRLLHFVRSRNLPFSTEDVKRVCSTCKICAELKPQFYHPTDGTLIKATQPMERLSIDFKGPLPSSSRNKYMLTVIDEYSRFPFAFPCPNMNSTTVIKCLEQIFAFCGMASFIHSDRGSSFMSQELKTYLSHKGIATSRTTPYHPIGNGQVERYNAIIWKAVRLALKSHNLPDQCWETVLPDALHSIRSLLSTSTNTTPHERFFRFQRRSTTGSSLPSWLTTRGPVLLRRFVRHSKNEPLVDQVELTEINPMYAHVRYPDGRESTVSLRDLAPCPNPSATPINERNMIHTESVYTPGEDIVHTEIPVNPIPIPTEPNEQSQSSVALRRSTRISKPPERYGF